ncbi:hypothetical protein [Streptomyces sp. KN37]|uniref:hypothetical protein n=1 Tax=Streptomyces sp. KN37 TaxID=3090667 RepID=UPI002A749908|nr:hypothetical protein [Streptomyces sp. KN37]WPO76289.1 hypothetical protein R9806_37055 [Streptomyces sp. KN37]
MSTDTPPEPDTDHGLTYPEPPASLLWHRHGPVRPLTDAERRHHREVLAAAQRKPHTDAEEDRSCSPT